MIEIPVDLKPLVLQGDVVRTLATLPRASVHCSVFSPPFWGLRRYDLCGCTADTARKMDRRDEGEWADHPLPNKHGKTHRSDPDPNCRWCHGTGTIPGMETVWGLGFMPCDHEWETTPPRRPRRAADEGNLPSKGNYDAMGGAFCARCHAWRGSLGLEPTPQLYVAHMVEVFRALRPVMRDDGIIWAEIGDTYITHPAGFTKGQKRWAASTLRPADRTGAEQAGLMDKRQPRRIWGRKNDLTPRPRHGGVAADPRFGGIFAGRDMSGHAGSGAMEKVVPGGLAEGNIAFVPHRVAMALQDDGWVVRQDIVGVWDRPNPMPESVRNRPSRSHSYIFQITKNMSYYWDRENARQAQTGNAHSRGRGSRSKPLPPPGEGVRANSDYNSAVVDQPPPEAGRNIVSVWRFPTHAFKGKHYATYPTELPRRCISIGTSDRGCCPECGAPFERVTTLGVPDREWQRLCGGDSRGEYAGESKGGYIEAGAEDPSDVKRRILVGLAPRITVGWRPRCSCFPDPCDKCGTPWTHRKVLQRSSMFNKRVSAFERGIEGGITVDEDASEEEVEDYDGGITAKAKNFKIVEVDASWPACSCRPLVPPVVLDIFAGSGTTPLVARQNYRRSIAIEISPYYVDMMNRRLAEETGGLAPKFVPQRRLTEFTEAV